jgi:hypothetical protein
LVLLGISAARLRWQLPDYFDYFLIDKPATLDSASADYSSVAKQTPFCRISS